MQTKKEELIEMHNELKLLQKEHSKLIEAYNNSTKVKECLRNLKDLGYETGVKIKTVTKKMLNDSDKIMQNKKLALIEFARNNGFEDMVLDATIYFTSKCNMDNHELDELLQGDFSQGLADSELGQGYFYVNKKYVDDVSVYLEKYATDIEVDVVDDIELVILKIE